MDPSQAGRHTATAAVPLRVAFRAPRFNGPSTSLRYAQGERKGFSQDAVKVPGRRRSFQAHHWSPQGHQQSQAHHWGPQGHQRSPSTPLRSPRAPAESKHTVRP